MQLPAGEIFKESHHYFTQTTINPRREKKMKHLVQVEKT